MTYRLHVRSILLLLSIILLGTACTLAGDPVPAGPIQTGPLPGEAVAADLPVSLPRAQSGAVIFVERCASCHGAGGLGDGPFSPQIAEQGRELPNLSDPVLARSRSPQEWYRIITNGTVNQGGLMPPWGEELTDSQRWDVTYYVYSLSQPPAEVAEAEELFVEFCAECHTPGAEAEAMLTDISTMATISLTEMHTLITNSTDGPHAIDGLDEEDAWLVAAFARTFAYEPPLAVAEVPSEDTPAEEPPAEETDPTEDEDIEPAEETGDSSGEEDTSAETPPEDETEETAETDQPIELRGDVEGVVSIAGGAMVPEGTGIELTGIVLDPSGSLMEVLALQTTTDADGIYRFENVSLDPAEVGAYVISASYNGVTFTTGSMIEPGVEQLNLPLTVYEATSDPNAISLDNLHLIIRSHPDALIVFQLLVFSNDSNAVYVTEQPVRGGQPGSVAISLPPDAYAVSFDEGQLGGRFVAVGDQIFDTEKVLPGDRTHSLLVTYALPYDGTYEFDIPINYDADQVMVMVSEEMRMRADDDILRPAGVEVIEGIPYNQYVGQSFASGENVSFRVGASGASSTLTRTLTTVGVALLVMLVVGAGVFWVMQRRRIAPVAAAAVAGGYSVSLLQQIADLDANYAAGRMNRFEYEAARADLKAQIAEAQYE